MRSELPSPPREPLKVKNLIPDLCLLKKVYQYQTYPDGSDAYRFSDPQLKTRNIQCVAENVKKNNILEG